MAGKKIPKKTKKTRQAPAPEPRAAVDRRGAGETPERHDGRAGGEGIIVAVGASAGGLEAFSSLLQALPPFPGFALILVQHLAPHHDSALPGLLSARTQLKVVQATEGVRVEPNHVYVIPPNVQMGITDSRLHLMPRPSDRTQYTPIDFFMRSLADSQQSRAIAVILSGTASDGTIGVREVKAVGGITIAQKPESARYDGMPRAAIATGFVDLVLQPDDIAQELVRITRHPLERTVQAMLPLDADEEVPATSDRHIEQIFRLLRTASGVDFRRYKRPTIERRLHRRMVLHKLPSVEQYVKLLNESQGEVQALYQDILIHVTRFFREPESFAQITASVLPKIMLDRRQDQPIRVWVPGCSTGEEAYSVAMVILEFLGDGAGSMPLQIFATDVSEPAIEHARSGLYPPAITADVSPSRLRRFFTRVDTGYRINKAVRDVCLFARQDLTRDPPFSKLDLILCRNVLIYMGVDLQKKLMSVFHYALRRTGFLVLGAAETVGVRSDLFTLADKKHRIFQKNFVAAPDIHYPFEYTLSPRSIARRETPPARDDDVKTVAAEANRVVQERYAPVGVIIDAALHIVQFRGQTGQYLEPAPGDPSVSILKMARDGLLHGLRAALQDARRTRTIACRKGLRVRANGGWRGVDVEVIPLSAEDRPHFLVLFTEPSARPRTATPARSREPKAAGEARAAGEEVTRLQQELASSREYLQSIIQELEAANEELQSANEEVLSANEELQSTNEELDTAKEELQSTNEELNTVNEELHGRNEELSRVNSDLMNLLGSVQIAIVIVTSDLRIRRFTPMAERVLNLLPADVGRPIGHVKPTFDCPDLEDQITHVIDTVLPIEREMVDRQGNWYSMRIRPYKSLDNRIDGAVIALFDINDARKRDEIVAEARNYSEAIVEAVQQPLLVLDKDLHVRSLNAAFASAFGLSIADVKGRPVEQIGNGGWNDGRLRSRLHGVLRDSDTLEGFEIRQAAGSAAGHTLVLRAERIVPGGHDPFVLLSFEEPTEPRDRKTR